MHEYKDAVFAQIHPDGGDELLVGLFYCSPSSNESVNEKLCTTFREIGSCNFKDVLIFGDFNFPEIDWKTESCTAGTGHAAYRFLESTRDAFLTQHQCEPTRYRYGQRSNILDLVFTSREETISDITTSAAIGKSDHCTLIFDMKLTGGDHVAREMKYLYDKADYDAMREKLGAVDWEAEFKEGPIEESWLFFKQKLHTVLDRYTPKKDLKGGVKKKPWMDTKTLNLVREKHRQYRKLQDMLRVQNRPKYSSSEVDAQHLHYARARNHARWACRKAVSTFERHIASGTKKCPKAFWSYVKSKTTVRESVANLTKQDGSTTTSNREKADVLQDTFTSIFTQENMDDMPTPPEIDFDTPLTDFEISSEEVYELLCNLKPSKSPGPDNLHPCILKELADLLCAPIAILFRKSMETGKLPEDWKSANVTPIFKKGSKSDGKNYRPISLTSIICKVLETLVRKQLTNHLHTNDLLSEHQHGFIAGRSCTTQLLEVLDEWTRVLDDGGTIDAVYMDFMKAFDTVPHHCLICKLEAYGVQGKLLAWIRAFLLGRRQWVVVGGQHSEWSHVSSGIPQGSVLGPTLFLVYVNDLPSSVQCGVKLFADDTKLCVRSDEAGASEKLQEDLNVLETWAERWQLRFHPDKCTVLKVGRSSSVSQYHMTKGAEPVVLTETKVERDLGVVVDSQLSFKDHISQVISKSNKFLGIIRRSFVNLDKDTVKLLFVGLIRPILEYGQAVWSPYRLGEQRRIESVQRRATRMVPAIKHLSYSERLQHLSLPSLHHRRMRGDMIDVYKYLHGLYNTNLDMFCRRENTWSLPEAREKVFQVRCEEIFLCK